MIQSEKKGNNAYLRTLNRLFVMIMKYLVKTCAIGNVIYDNILDIPVIVYMKIY